MLRPENWISQMSDIGANIEEGTPTQLELVPPPPEVQEVFGEKLPLVVDAYGAIIAGDSPYRKRAEITQISEAELKRHLQDLAVLKSFLVQFAQNSQGFEVRERRVDTDRGIFIARLIPRGAGPIRPGYPQTQFSMYTTIRSSGDTRDNAIKAASLRGLSPDRAARRADREISHGTVTINGVELFRPREYAQISVRPMVGIKVTREGEYVDVDGVIPVGAEHHHALPVDNDETIDITQAHFQTLSRVGMKLSGVGEPPRPQSRA